MNHKPSKKTNQSSNNLENYSIEWKKLHIFNDTHTIWKILLSALVIRGVLNHKKTIENVMTDFEINSRTFFPHQILPYVYQTLYPLHRKGIKALTHQTSRYWFSVENWETQSEFQFPNKKDISPLFFDILKVSIIAQLYEQDKSFMWGYETVELIKILFPTLEKVATAYLRTIQRYLEGSNIPRPLGDTIAFDARMVPDLPQWWQKKLTPLAFQAVRKAFGTHPQLFLRLNPIYLQSLNNSNNSNDSNISLLIQNYIQTYNEQKKPEHQQIQAVSTDSNMLYSLAGIKNHTIGAIKAPNVRHIPGFMENGSCSVQDLSAQYLQLWIQKVVKLANTLGDVLEVGTAPGGKLGLLLEQWFLNPQLCDSITSIDNDEYRMAKVYDLLKRLQIPTKLTEKLSLVTADATTEKFNKKFNTIIIDAPCSASGVIRKHPEIVLNRQWSDVEELVELQKKILQTQWKNLAPNGFLIYMTCSIFTIENQVQIQEFLLKHQDCELLEEQQLLPITNTDVNITTNMNTCNNVQSEGFYYALLSKSSKLSN